MANMYRILGRLTGRALRSQAVDQAVSRMSGYALGKLRLADIKLKLRLLRQKRTNHIKLLGRTVYRLADNGLNPIGNPHTETIVRVLTEIDLEIDTVETELKRRQDFDRHTRESKHYKG